MLTSNLKKLHSQKKNLKKLHLYLATEAKEDNELAAVIRVRAFYVNYVWLSMCQFKEDRRRFLVSNKF